MKATRVPAVVTGKNPAFTVNLTAERVATTFGKNFEPARLRVITPNLLPHGVRHRLFVQSRTHHAGSHRAALATIEPSVRSPSQAVDYGMRILQTETG